MSWLMALHLKTDFFLISLELGEEQEGERKTDADGIVRFVGKGKTG